MSSRTFLIFGALFLVLIAAQVAILVRFQRQVDLASIECHATNAGIPLGPKDGRAFVYPTDEPQRLAAEGDLNTALEVPPGRYDVRVLFSRARDQQSEWSRGITLAQGKREVRQFEFAAGEVSVEATVGGGTAQTKEVVVYVFTPEDHNRIITSMGSGERALIAAGVYDLRVVLTNDSEEKDIRWLRGVTVDAGLHSQQKIAFRRGTLWVRARNAGAELPSAAVALVVYQSGEVQKQVLDSGLAGLPLGLAAGQYDVKATFTKSNDKPSRWLRNIQIRDGETLKEDVKFTSGTIIVDAAVERTGPLEKFHAYAYYYHAGNHQQPVAYTPAGEAAILEAGRYDVRVSFHRSHDRPDIWVRDIVIAPGVVLRKSVTFRSGKLLVRAYNSAGAELVGDNVFVYVYATGESSRPIAVARSGEIIILTAGSYNIRAQDTRNARGEIWFKNISLKAGILSEHSATFD